MTRVLLTGAAGDVGGRLRKLLKPIYPELRLSDIKTPPDLGPDEKFIAADLANQDQVDKAVEGMEGIIHLAAHVHQQHPGAADDPAFFTVNVEGTRRLMEIAIAAGVRDFVFASSVKAVGEGGALPWTEETPPQPEDAYGRSKLEGERIVRHLATERGIHAPILRFPMVYGPGMKANILRLFRAVDRNAVFPFASVRNRRSFLFVGNLTAAVVATLGSERGNDTFFVSDGQDLSVPELIASIAMALNRRPRLVPVPVPLLRGAAFAADIPARFLKRTLPSGALSRLTGSLAIDPGKLTRLTGFRPPYSVMDGLRATAEWFRTSGMPV
jgi:UDP-glucose 4-epimerase